MSGRLLKGLRKAMHEASKIRSNEATQAAVAPIVAAVGAVTLRKLVGEAVNAIYDEKGWRPKHAVYSGMNNMVPSPSGNLLLTPDMANSSAAANAANQANQTFNTARRGMGWKGGLGMAAMMTLPALMGGGGGNQPLPMNMVGRPGMAASRMRRPMPQMRMPTGQPRMLTLPSLGSVRRASDDSKLSKLLNQFKEQ